jgi:hypothetical protein
MGRKSEYREEMGEKYFRFRNKDVTALRIGPNARKLNNFMK